VFHTLVTSHHVAQTGDRHGKGRDGQKKKIDKANERKGKIKGEKMRK